MARCVFGVPLILLLGSVAGARTTETLAHGRESPTARKPSAANSINFATPFGNRELTSRVAWSISLN